MQVIDTKVICNRDKPIKKFGGDDKLFVLMNEWMTPKIVGISKLSVNE